MYQQVLSALGYHVLAPDYRGWCKWRFMTLLVNIFSISMLLFFLIDRHTQPSHIDSQPCDCCRVMQLVLEELCVVRQLKRQQFNSRSAPSAGFPSEWLPPGGSEEQLCDLSVSISWCEKLWQGLEIPPGSRQKPVWPLMPSTCTTGSKHAVETAWLSSGDTLLALG